MADQAALNRILTQFTETIVGQYDIGHVLYRLTDHVTEILGVSGAGVSIATEDHGLRFVAATDEAVGRVEEQQVNVAEGPCHDAYRKGVRVIVPDLAAEDRWPEYTETALKAGCRSVAGLPLQVEGEAIGALNIYHTEVFDWPEEDVATAHVLANMASGYVVNARQLAETQQLADQLQHALDSRIVIEQAKGLVAARSGEDIHQAFERLRVYARSHNRRLHDVARDVVQGTVQL